MVHHKFNTIIHYVENTTKYTCKTVSTPPHRFIRLVRISCSLPLVHIAGLWCAIDVQSLDPIPLVHTWPLLCAINFVIRCLSLSRSLSFCFFLRPSRFHSHLMPFSPLLCFIVTIHCYTLVNDSNRLITISTTLWM